MRRRQSRLTTIGDLLLGIDVGTASSKGVLLRPDGSAVADARADHGMDVPRPGWAEQDADAVWWTDVVAIAQRLSAAVPAGDRIAGVACSAIGPTLLAHRTALAASPGRTTSSTAG